jgi:hypothetical protein
MKSVNTTTKMSIAGHHIEDILSLHFLSCSQSVLQDDIISRLPHSTDSIKNESDKTFKNILKRYQQSGFNDNTTDFSCEFESLFNILQSQYRYADVINDEYFIARNIINSPRDATNRARSNATFYCAQHPGKESINALSRYIESPFARLLSRDDQINTTYVDGLCPSFANAMNNMYEEMNDDGWSLSIDAPTNLGASAVSTIASKIIMNIAFRKVTEPEIKFIDLLPILAEDVIDVFPMSRAVEVALQTSIILDKQSSALKLYAKAFHSNFKDLIIQTEQLAKLKPIISGNTATLEICLWDLAKSTQKSAASFHRKEVDVMKLFNQRSYIELQEMLNSKTRIHVKMIHQLVILAYHVTEYMNLHNAQEKLYIKICNAASNV